MKKILSIIMAAVFAMLCMTGCQLSEKQVALIARNVGVFSAVGWIAVDNPDVEEIAAVSSVLGIIVEQVPDVSLEVETTYTELLYPEAVKLIDSDLVKPQYRPLCKAGCLTILSGIDILFASKPEWKLSDKLSLKVVNSFVEGAQWGFSLMVKDPKSPLSIAVRNMAKERSRILSQ